MNQGPDKFIAERGRAVGSDLAPHDSVFQAKSLKKRPAAIGSESAAAGSVVHGMPGEAVRLGAATPVLLPEGIAATLASLLGQTNG